MIIKYFLKTRNIKNQFSFNYFLDTKEKCLIGVFKSFISFNNNFGFFFYKI